MYAPIEETNERRNEQMSIRTCVHYNYIILPPILFEKKSVSQLSAFFSLNFVWTDGTEFMNE